MQSAESDETRRRITIMRGRRPRIGSRAKKRKRAVAPQRNELLNAAVAPVHNTLTSVVSRSARGASAPPQPIVNNSAAVSRGVSQEARSSQVGRGAGASVDDDDEETATGAEIVAETIAELAEEVRAAAKKGPATTRSRRKRAGPGRPRKTPKKEPMERWGVAQAPECADNVVELRYGEPMNVKKIIAFFKTIATEEVQIIFAATHITFYAVDHGQTGFARVRFDAAKLNHYYFNSERPIEIGLNRESLQKVLNKIDNECVSVEFILQARTQDQHMRIRIINLAKIIEIHDINLMGEYERVECKEEFNDSSHMINFVLPGKSFKRVITDIKASTQEFNIEQCGPDDCLEFNYVSTNCKTTSRRIMSDSDEICLHSDLGKDDTLCVSIRVGDIKPIAAAHISKTIQIFVDENKKFMTRSTLDEGTIEILTLNEIIGC